MSSVTYRIHDNMFVRFVDHLKLGLSSNIGANRTEANRAEKAGNQLLKIAELPIHAAKGVARKMQDPRYVTVALTALALLGNSALFYPTETKQLVDRVVTEVQKILEHVDLAKWIRCGAFATSTIAIAGYGLRAEGRWTNTELMKNFYGTLKVEENPAGMWHSEILANR